MIIVGLFAFDSLAHPLTMALKKPTTVQNVGHPKHVFLHRKISSAIRSRTRSVAQGLFLHIGGTASGEFV